ncbi:response regulator transcription factor [Paludibacterium yongneupense]|uniref:response regulator transcription factor n=1 Tax=Paludibacterium yongneupense TaxID=400061 RepID=UPI000416AA15|nr:response regulator [Paludibacterium yongneupense]
MVAPKTVLVVDDSRVARMMLRHYIQASCPDWLVFESESGEQAIADLEDVEPDVVAMDINMKGMSGLDAAEEIRRLYPHIWVVLITANIQESSRQRAADMGARFLPKPVTQASVAAMLDECMLCTGPGRSDDRVQ